MRNNTPDQRHAEIRWEVLKEMLDNFPDLRARTETYLLTKETVLKSNYPKGTSPTTKELLKKAIKEYKQKARASDHKPPIST